jgi:tetratricopeptide (TPR) repeat protein
MAVDSGAPAYASLGPLLVALNRFFHGQSREGLASLQQSTGMDSVAASYSAAVLLDKGEPARALEQAVIAQRKSLGDQGEWEGLFFASLAQARMGQSSEAEQTAETLRRKTEKLPTEKEKRRYLHLLGEMAFNRGDIPQAIDQLSQAQTMLAPRGFVCMTQHVPVWFSLASAYLAAGDEGRAEQWFRRISESTSERIWWPIPYVRSFYFLGQIHENRGEMEKARECYRRFFEYWKDGDMDRERVEEARNKLQT